MKSILKVLVGSRAHGLNDKNSDYDYRGVFVVPTDDLFKIGNTKKNTSWVEGKVDDTSWEVSHFLKLAVKCNPSVLEVFLAPEVSVTQDGKELIALFPYVWNSVDVMNAFIGYGHNQRKKFLEKKDGRPDKFAVAYIRTLRNAYQLLTTGTFDVEVKDSMLKECLLRYKKGIYRIGEIIDYAERLENKVREAYLANSKKETDIDKINQYLINLRRKY